MFGEAVAAVWCGRTWTGVEGETELALPMPRGVPRVAQDEPFDVEMPRWGVSCYDDLAFAIETRGVSPTNAALRDRSTLLVVDASNRLYLRAAETVRLERERALVRAVLAPGDRICVSPLEVVVNGMPVVAVEIDPDEALGRGASS